LTAVTFWAYGGVAYPYTLLAALTTICAILSWRAVNPATARSQRGFHLLAASAAWGIAIGFRSDLAIFLAPLLLLAATRAAISRAALCLRGATRAERPGRALGRHRRGTGRPVGLRERAGGRRPGPVPRGR